MLDNTRLKIFGKLVDINLEVDQFSFSNHADHSLLVDFAQQVGANDVILFHGNRDEGQELLKKELESEEMTIHQPENCQSYLL